MKVRFLKSWQGYVRGDEDDIVSARALALVEGGFAERVYLSEGEKEKVEHTPTKEKSEGSPVRKKRTRKK